MSEAARGSPRGARLVLLAALAGVCALHAAAFGRHLEAPGPYYDEVIQARPARELVEGRVRAPLAPGGRAVKIAGRRVPWRTQSYMGAVKTQLLTLPFAAIGPSVETLRATTVAWHAAGLALATAWLWVVAGPAPALVAGGLLALDPGAGWIGRHDWGSFSLATMLRSAALLLATLAWVHRRRDLAFAAGLAFGLGIYNKVDFAWFGAALAAGALAAGAGRAALRERGLTAWAVAGLALGVLPVLPSIPDVLAAWQVVAARATLGEKLRVLAATGDGTYFLRLLHAGGRFERMFDGPGIAGSPLGLLSLAAILPALLWPRRLAASEGAVAALRFTATSLAGGLALVLLLPGASRAHHVLNLHPLPPLLVGLVGAGLWRHWRGRRVPRAVLVLVLAWILLADARVNSATLRDAVHSGGRGWWSDAITDVARSEDRPERTLVSLDWGFHEPLAFLTSRATLVEPIWAIPRSLAARRPWRFVGGPDHVYLVHDERFDLFRYGVRLLAASRRLDPARVTLRRYLDREGGTAFWTVRLHGRHELRYDGGWRIGWLGAARPAGRGISPAPRAPRADRDGSPAP